ncbi:MAG: hypothetical protein PHY92_04120 [Alphaproteobacteria bacterium]|nr:hypothetical protein [Alphaproteobacteria bacterium]
MDREIDRGKYKRLYRNFGPEAAFVALFRDTYVSGSVEIRETPGKHGPIYYAEIKTMMSVAEVAGSYLHRARVVGVGDKRETALSQLLWGMLYPCRRASMDFKYSPELKEYLVVTGPEGFCHRFPIKKDCVRPSPQSRKPACRGAQALLIAGAS